LATDAGTITSWPGTRLFGLSDTKQKRYHERPTARLRTRRLARHNAPHQKEEPADPWVGGLCCSRAERLVRAAAERGAQIICLKELFNAVYFCKSQQCDRFDLAEPIPGPDTDRDAGLARELGVVLIVPIFERQAAGLYRNSAAVVDADGTLLGVYRKMHIPDDPLFNEKYYFTPGDGHLDYHGERPGESPRASRSGRRATPRSAC
jgi:hypothetical protein